MRNLISANLVFLLVVLALVSCQNESEPSCLEVEILGPEQCTLGTIVSVKSKKMIGNTIRYFDGNTYSNVIRIYSEVTISSSGKAFIQLREFDPTRDEQLANQYATICQAIFAPFPVPTKVATFWSESPC
ncbi:hypothetical protein CLV31_11248 [Algoriphagus aquaeductus]|uniref:Tissue inhibitor of metalloproteinase n=1 Tax=Algoriphagus aquaeductus TaxID=475299 RepID=A0A326RR09_9BACT|nr:hypothetical protein [Algoriphagus aquaeductus]PZV80281.1 hypothetical protein CLV31_11248 [Algoriphagus aquaeductus]